MKGRTNVGGGKPEEEKTVTAGTSVIEVNPSSGKVMKKVTVNPTPTESKSVTPTTSELTVTPSEGKHLSQVVVGAVEDVTPEVTAQTPVITQIAENLGVTITTPSGTNKQILQGNNANLLNIKNNAKKEGAYVWKKLFKDTISFSFVKQGSPAILQATAISTDLSQVTADFFVGLKGTVGVTGATYEFITASICEVNGDSYTYTYDPTTARITVNGAMGGEIGSAEKIAFVDFTVSDSPTAYPDRGEQDGYWYEKVVEGLTPEMFGCTKMAIDTVTYSSDQSGDRWDGLRINHSLGTVPKFSILLANGNVPEIKNYIKFSITTFPNAYRGGSLSIGYSEYNGWCSEGFNSASSDYQPTPTDTYAEFKPGNMSLGSLCLKAGIEYTLITMA